MSERCNDESPVPELEIELIAKCGEQRVSHFADRFAVAYSFL